jgi:thiol:disulfide interchange protein
VYQTDLCCYIACWNVIFLGDHALRIIKIVSLVLFLASVAEIASGKDQISWMHDMDAALAAAKQENRPLMIDFMAEWCAPCKEMESSTFSNPDVILKAKAFISVRIDVDKQKQVAAKFNALPRAYGGIGIPNMLFLTSAGTEIKSIIGACNAKKLLAAMNSVLKRKSK